MPKKKSNAETVERATAPYVPTKAEWIRKRLEDLSRALSVKVTAWDFRTRLDVVMAAEWADEISMVLNEMDDEDAGVLDRRVPASS